MTTAPELACPKCHAPMRQYERNGVLVDQCTECRGIFLDRGELERLVDAEQTWQSAQRPVQSVPSTQAAPMPPMRDEPTRERTHGYQPRRKKSFLEELFD